MARAYPLRREFVVYMMQLPPGAAVALAPFAGEDYGDEYLTFGVRDLILPRLTPPGINPDGWGYGLHVASGSYGWYPPHFAV